MALEALVRKLERHVRGKDILHHVPLPSIAILGDLEVAELLKRRFQSDELIVVYAPRFLEQTGYRTFKIDGVAAEGLLLPGQAVSYAMSALYENSGARRETDPDLESLEAAIGEERLRKEANQKQLRRLGEEVALSGTQNPEQTKAMIYGLIMRQFGQPEHFVRELIQNASAAAPDPEKGRIDVYLRPEERLIRVEDNGVGMSQAVMEKVFFNLFASLNENLSHAEGKFGIGAKSCFGLGHEYVKVDSMPASGEQGGLAIVNANLERSDTLLPNERTTPGTTIEIKLSKDSDVSFDTAAGILREDCCYVETPIFLHIGERTEKINRPLFPDDSGVITFREDRVQGYIAKAEEGALMLLSHGIRLASLPTVGYEGAVNCAEFGKTFSRDSVVDDPVLRYVLAYVRRKSRELPHHDEIDRKKLSLEARLADYRRFVYSSLFNRDGSPNKGWIRRNLDDLLHITKHHTSRFDHAIEDTITGSVITFGVGTISDAVSSAAELIKKLPSVKGRKVSPKLIAAGAGVAGAGWLSYDFVRAFISLDITPSLYAVPAVAGSALLPMLTLLAEGGLRYALMVASDKIAERLVNSYVGRTELLRFGNYKALNKDSILPGLAVSFAAISASIAALFYGAKLALPLLIDKLPSIGVEAVAAAPLSQVGAGQAGGGEATAAEPSLLLYAGATAALVSLGYGLYRASRNGKFKPYAGELSEQQERLLSDVRQVVAKLGLEGEVSVHFSRGLKEGQEGFAVKKSTIALNRHEAPLPWAPVLSYAAKVLRDPEVAGNITARYVLAK